MAAAIGTLSQGLAEVAERAGTSVVTVHARARVPSSGIVWRKGVVVTADHTIRREDDITVLTHEGKHLTASLAGRDAATDLAVLKIEDQGQASVASTGDSSAIKLASLVLALGRTRFGNLVASAGIVGGLSGEWRSWRGGRIDQNIRLDLELYPGLSGGPLVNSEGKVVGLNTGGLDRGRSVAIPVSTVNRTVDELLEKGHVARPHLGLALQSVAIPETLRGKFKSTPAGGLMVLHAETGGPAEQAGIVLGDVIVELAGRPAQDLRQIRNVLASGRVGQKVGVAVLRAGLPVELSITLGERPAR
jgi:S1-C subfamily serine protease